jgi:assimilatory nitrate reductase catalytic subunit
MGVNQGHEATRTAQAIINLALMTGNIGRPGTGANSITGQCNAMGSRLFSNTTNLLGGWDFTNAEHRNEVARLLGIPSERIPTRNSLAYDQILEAIANDEIKGLWVVATNTAHSWINQHAFREIRNKLDFLVVQDMYHTTDTAMLADLALPAAGWGEKDGTFINSERRFGLARKVARSPGQALSDFNIFKLVAHYWGCAEMFREWTSPEAVFQILKRLSAGRPCDITGIRDFQHLDECGGIQWPWTRQLRSAPVLGRSEFRLSGPPKFSRTSSNLEAAAPEDGRTPPVLQPAKERRLFADGRFFTPDGKARFIFEQPRPLPEPTDDEYPFTLLTGRGTSAQWHTGTRTEKSDVLRQLRPAAAYVEINPADSRRLHIPPNSTVRISSRRGAITAKAFVTATIQPGHLFVPMHYAQTNLLTHSSFDPYSRQPSYKACAVRLERLKHTRGALRRKARFRK